MKESEDKIDVRNALLAILFLLLMFKIYTPIIHSSNHTNCYLRATNDLHYCNNL